MIHKMIACSEECLRLACCDFCVFAMHEYFFEKDKDGKLNRIDGGPIGCRIHLDKEHQEIAENLGYCNDFYCIKATEENKDSWVVKEISDEED